MNNLKGLLEFLRICYTDGEIDEAEMNMYFIKAEQLGYSKSEAEFYLNQFKKNPDGFYNEILKQNEIAQPRAGSKQKLKAKQEIILGLNDKDIHLSSISNLSQLLSLNYDKLFQRTVASLNLKTNNKYKIQTLDSLRSKIENLNQEKNDLTNEKKGFDKQIKERDSKLSNPVITLGFIVFFYTYFNFIGLNTEIWIIISGILFSSLLTALILWPIAAYKRRILKKQLSEFYNKRDSIINVIESEQLEINNLTLILTTLETNLSEQNEFNQLVEKSSKDLSVNPFDEQLANNLISSTDIQDSDFQKFMTNCLFLKDNISKIKNEINTEIDHIVSNGFPNHNKFIMLKGFISQINIFIAILNSYSLSLNNLSERTKLEHFLGENLLNISKVERLKLDGMQNMLYELNSLNLGIRNVANEIKSVQDAIDSMGYSMGATLENIEYSIDNKKTI